MADLDGDLLRSNQNITSDGRYQPAKRVIPQRNKKLVYSPARVAQLAVEVVTQNADAPGRVGQLAIETLVRRRTHFNRDKNITATGRWRPAARAAPQRIPNRLFFEGAATYEFGVTADAIILATPSGGVTADAVVLREQGGSATADAVLSSTQSGSITADGVIRRSQEGTGTADAVLRATQTASLTADAFIEIIVSGSFTADAIIKRTQSGSATADAVVTAGECADPPVWTTPGDGDPILPLPTFGFTIPVAEGPLHFDLNIDTVSTFDSGNLRIHQSYPNQTGWEYWDGDSWEPIPSTGVTQSFAGNEARYTLQTPLADNTWFRRIRAVVVS